MRLAGIQGTSPGHPGLTLETLKVQALPNGTFKRSCACSLMELEGSFCAQS